MNDPVYKRNEPYVDPGQTERPTTIIAASILHKGHIWAGRRHFQLIQQIKEDTGERAFGEEQGFLTNTGHHCMRSAAMAIVRRYKQIPDEQKTFQSIDLFSEDLWP